MEVVSKEFKDVKPEEIAHLFDLVWSGQKFSSIVSKTKWAFYNDHSKVVLFEAGSKLVAARGSFEWPLALKKNNIKTYQFHGTCVHPDFRRKGIFTSINKKFIAEAIKENYDLIFNVSVDNSRAGYEKLGWKYLKGFHRMTYVNNPIKFFSRKLKAKKSEINENFIIESATEIPTIEKTIPPEFLEARKIQFKNTITTNYSNDFLKWRLNNPCENYKIHSTEKCTIIYKININKGIKELIIGDFFILEKEYKLFSRNLRQIIKKEKPDITYTYIFKTHPYFNYYIRYLFLPNPFNFNLNFGTKTLNEKTEDFIKDKKWALGFLDIDTF